MAPSRWDLGSANATTDLLITINGSTTNRLFSIPDATFENGTFETTPLITVMEHFLSLLDY